MQPIEELVYGSDVEWNSIQNILSENLGIRQVAAKFGAWFFQHDNSPVHTAFSVRRFLSKNGMTTGPHSTYSANLAPSDYFLFPRMKRDMKRMRLADTDEEKKNDRGAGRYYKR